jgi:hypothetical protein
LETAAFSERLYQDSKVAFRFSAILALPKVLNTSKMEDERFERLYSYYSVLGDGWSRAEMESDTHLVRFSGTLSTLHES